MKHLALIAAFALAGLLPSGAVTLNMEAYGAALHGWKKDRTASYTINNNRYRTHQPTGTVTDGGGLFLSTRIEEGGRLSTGAVSFLELTFDPGGALIAAQIRMRMHGKRFNTGLVTRKPVVPPLPDEIGPSEPEMQNPTNALVMDLFTRLDTELAKLEGKDGGNVRRDLFGRITGSASKETDVPSAIRHNLNLILTHIGPGMWIDK